MIRPTPGWRVCALAPLLLTPLLGACGREASVGAGGEDAARAPSRWGLSPAPLVEIGVVEGEEPYELSAVKSATRLSDGRIAVLNGGSHEIRLYSAEGRYLVSAGREGDGPGEFRFPARLWRGMADTLRVYDAGGDRFSFFAGDGAFLRTEAAGLVREDAPTEVSADPFRLDIWVHGWNWIDSPLPPEERGGVVAALARLPAPDTALGVRFVRVADTGLLWVTSPVPPSDQPSRWQIHLPDGTQLATVEMPARFEPLELGSDYVLGKYRNELEVEFVRLYALEGVGEARAPGLAPLRGQGPATYPAPPEEAAERMRDALKAAASHQEIGYSKKRTYQSDVAALEIPPERMPAGVRLQVMMADARGWAGVALDKETGASCALGYGATMPVGWVPAGMILCPGSAR